MVAALILVCCRDGFCAVAGRRRPPGRSAPQRRRGRRQGLHERGAAARAAAVAGQHPCGDAGSLPRRQLRPAADKPADPAAPGATPKTEAEWKKRIADERDALSRAQTFAEALQSRINVLSADFVNVDDPARRDVVAAERQKALSELDRVKTEIQAHQKKITDIQTEARKAGVPAGWVR